MNKDLEKIKMILCGLSSCSEAQYKRLVEVYGIDLVTTVASEIAEQSKEIEVNNLSINECYARDVESLGNKSRNKKNDLLVEVCLIVKELNKLLDQVDDMIVLCNGNKVPWICDKVDYSIKNCMDLELLDKIKNVYERYLNKRNILLESYLKYVLMTAKSFFYSNDQLVPLEDLVQYGNMGLIRAIELFDIEKDKAFLTYASYWVRQSMIVNSKKYNNQMLFPVRWFDIKVKRGKVFEQLTQVLGRYPKVEELSLSLEIDADMLEKISMAFRPFVSLDEFTEVKTDELSDVIPNGVNLSKIEFVSDMREIDEDIICGELSSEIEYYMDLYLTEREKFILKARYGFIDEISVLELAKMYGVSEQRIYQIIKGAFGKLCKNKEFRKMKIYLR